IIKHLEHFLISEQVEFADQTRAFAQLYLAGPQAKDLLGKALGGPLPDLQEHQVILREMASNQHCQIRHGQVLGVPGYDLVFPSGESEAVWKQLVAAGCRPAGWAAYEALRIEAGFPWYGIDLDENTFAPEVNRIPQTISYTKGCFLGQE